MRSVRRLPRFRRDYRRELRGQRGPQLEAELRAVLEPLIADRPLPERCVDHALAGEWKDYRDCHVRPDLVLIYRKRDADVLELVRLGSHSELEL
jgi:mRNA interferase YafQ